MNNDNIVVRKKISTLAYTCFSFLFEVIYCKTIDNNFWYEIIAKRDNKAYYVCKLDYDKTYQGIKTFLLNDLATRLKQEYTSFNFKVLKSGIKLNDNIFHLKQQKSNMSNIEYYDLECNLKEHILDLQQPQPKENKIFGIPENRKQEFTKTLESLGYNNTQIEFANKLAFNKTDTPEQMLKTPIDCIDKFESSKKQLSVFDFNKAQSENTNNHSNPNVELSQINNKILKQLIEVSEFIPLKSYYEIFDEITENINNHPKLSDREKLYYRTKLTSIKLDGEDLSNRFARLHLQLKEKFSDSTKFESSKKQLSVFDFNKAQSENTNNQSNPDVELAQINNKILKDLNEVDEFIPGEYHYEILDKIMKDINNHPKLSIAENLYYRNELNEIKLDGKDLVNRFSRLYLQLEKKCSDGVEFEDEDEMEM